MSAYDRWLEPDDEPDDEPDEDGLDEPEDECSDEAAYSREDERDTILTERY